MAHVNIGGGRRRVLGPARGIALALGIIAATWGLLLWLDTDNSSSDECRTTGPVAHSCEDEPPGGSGGIGEDAGIGDGATDGGLTTGGTTGGSLP
ncbi:hypothetical protein GCM10009801_32310 [Streptomyces albiaxialis]|uniref:Uncharacterized protein n=1 Tax=Streptomyces albiaxialis TaxID=329523 RepID=A0ABN2W1N9_9ACTN